MADTARTEAQLRASFADNIVGAITAQDGRDLIVSSMGYIASRPPTPDDDNANTGGTGQFFDAGSKWVDGSTFTVYFCADGSPGAAIWVQACCDGSINIRDMGATGDGVTDDGPAIRDALALVTANGGGAISVPAGAYRINSTVPYTDGSSTGTAGLYLANTHRVTMRGVGMASEFVFDGITATEGIRIQTCDQFVFQDLWIRVQGTADLVDGLHITTSSPGSAHDTILRNVRASNENGNPRPGLTSGAEATVVAGSPVLTVASYPFSPADVGALVAMSLFGPYPFIATVLSVATRTTTLGAAITTTTQTQLTFALAMPFAPNTQYGVLIDSELMLVTSGGTGTTPVVSRGILGTTAAAHANGATVTTYQATLSANSPQTNHTSPMGIIRAGLAILQNGISFGVDHPGASDMDIAEVRMEAIVVNRAIVGLNGGNGTVGNVLNLGCAGIEVLHAVVGVFSNGALFSGADWWFGNNGIDFQRAVGNTQAYSMRNVRTENPVRLMVVNGGTADPPCTLADVMVAAPWAADTILLNYLSSGALLLSNLGLKLAYPSQTLNYAISGAGSASPCVASLINVYQPNTLTNPFSGSNVLFNITPGPLVDANGAITANTRGNPADYRVLKFTVTFSQLTALGAVAAGDITLRSLMPAFSVIQQAYYQVLLTQSFSGGAIMGVTAQLKTSTGTLFGNSQAWTVAANTEANMAPDTDQVFNFFGTTSQGLLLHVTSSGANLNALTQGTATIWVYFLVTGGP